MQALREDGQGALEAGGLTLLQLLCSCDMRASLLQCPLHVGLLMRCPRFRPTLCTHLAADCDAVHPAC